MPVLKNYLEFFKCKDLYMRCCHNICKDPTVYQNATDFLLIHKNSMSVEPELTDYIYQTALQAVFYKKRVPNFDLENFLKNRFKITDPYYLNRGCSDISTVNTLFIMDHITEKGMFANSSIEVFSTPFVYQTKPYYNAQKTSAKEYVEQSKAVTDNTNADVRIDHRIYDIKHTVETPVTKNHIYPWTYEKIEHHGLNHLKNLHQSLNTRHDNTDVHKKLVRELKDIINDKKLDVFEKNDEWNLVIQKNFGNLSPNYTLPIVTQMTDYPYQAKLTSKQLEKIHISPDVQDDIDKARRAIAGACFAFGPQKLKNAYIVSQGAISVELLQTDNEVD